MCPTKTKTVKYSLAVVSILALAALVVMLVNFDLNESGSPSVLGAGTGKTITTSQCQPTQTSSKAPLTVSDESSEERARLKKEQSRLLEKLKRLESSVKEMKADLATQRQAVNSENPPDPNTIAEKQEAEEERINAQRKAQVDLLDNTIETEPSDPEWSSEAAWALETKLSQQKNIQELTDIQCRSTMCRMKFTFRPGDNEENLRHLQELIPWNGEIYFQIDDSGEAVIYVARENNSLPRVSQ